MLLLLLLLRSILLLSSKLLLGGILLLLLCSCCLSRHLVLLHQLQGHQSVSTDGKRERDALLLLVLDLTPHPSTTAKLCHVG